MKIAVYFNFITGMMIGAEYVEHEDEENVKSIVIDLFILRACITWGDLESQDGE